MRQREKEFIVYLTEEEFLKHQAEDIADRLKKSRPKKNNQEVFDETMKQVEALWAEFLVDVEKHIRKRLKLKMN